MLAISVREALRNAINAFGKVDFILPSPCTGEAVKSLIHSPNSMAIDAGHRDRFHPV